MDPNGGGQPVAWRVGVALARFEATNVSSGVDQLADDTARVQQRLGALRDMFVAFVDTADVHGDLSVLESPNVIVQVACACGRLIGDGDRWPVDQVPRLC